MVINKILYLLCQLIRPLIYIVYNTTYKLYINSGDVMLILGGENLFTKPSYFYHNTNGLLLLRVIKLVFSISPRISLLYR